AARRDPHSFPTRRSSDLLRSARPVKAIALSGFGSEKDVRACKEAGFDEHLTKPVALETLTRTIESLMAHAEAATKRLVTPRRGRSEEHTSELQSRSDLVC